MAGKIRNEASSSSNSKGESVVVDVGRRRSSCGYCRSVGRTSVAHGLWAHSITVDDYQDLLDRGWRRSGCFLYKPEMDKTCCPSYTIRLKAGEFVAAKEQSRVSRRMQRFLDGTLDGKKPDLLTDESNTSNSAAKKSSSGSCEGNNEEEQYLQHISNQIGNVVRAWAGSEDFPSDIQFPKASVKKVTHTKKKQIGGSEDLLYSSNISFQIAATLRRSKLAEKDACVFGVAKSGTDQNGQSSEVSPKIIAEKLASALNQLGEFSSLSTRACNGHLNFYSASRQVPSGERVGTTNVSSNSPGSTGVKRCSMAKNTKCSQQKRRRLEIRLKKSSFDPEEYALYRKYQIKVHHDAPDQVMESSYRRFLVDTPIVFVPPSGDGSVPPCGFGSFHQQYVVDGRLVAVGVVDILPRCLSSKYLFWDPDFAFLSLGKYSALQEISWVKETQAVCPSLQYYYLGYYIHSCSKMRYKAAYNPSELLCPLRYQWIPFYIARPLLDRKPYVILSDFATLQNGESSPHQLPQNSIGPQYENPGREDPIETLSDDDGNDDDEEMVEPDYEGSDVDDSDPETGTSVDEIKDGDVSSVLIGLKNSRIRFKDLQRALGSSEKQYMKIQLHRYIKAVGAGLSEHMVYLLG
ncbi:Arginine-tRNA-protein transferase [Macleaya cordata]|uniref:Arginyl-tRNA--protein transferase n=1 Tax=Macleaya cordata TaxID=56857 RepID=A0A200PWY0_MACCD|nr:Arginine-tRNA-protein transferase [Macleaya cordata]